LKEKNKWKEVLHMFLHRMIVAEQHKGRSATTSFDRFGEQLELFHVVAEE
jgi:hypothetical protein